MISSKINFDKESLVKNSIMEPNKNDLTPQYFFNYQQDLRLSIIRNTKGEGRALANLIDTALNKYIKMGYIKEDELHDILIDYILSPNFSIHYQFSHKNKNLTLDLDALWKSALYLPEKISFIFLDNLPECNSETLNSPEELIKHLSDKQLERILEREDLVIEKLRRYVFKNHNEITLRLAAPGVRIVVA
jgi:hypothetical protein